MAGRFSLSGFSHVGEPDGIKAWDLDTGRQSAFTGSKGWKTGIAISHDGSRIASCGKDGIVFWNAANGQQLDRLAALAVPVTSVAYSPDGQALAYTSGNRLIILNAQNHRPMHTFQASGDDLHSVTFSPDGTRIGAVAGTKL